MAGDLSLSGHNVRLISTVANPLIAIGDEINFPGNAAAYIRVEDSDNWQFGGDFTIELFGVKFTSKTTVQGLIANYDSSSDQRSWFLIFRGDVSPKVLDFLGSTAGTSATATSIQAEFDPVLGQPYDIRVDRAGSTVRVYVGASMLASGTISGALHNSTSFLVVGGLVAVGVVGSPFHGRLKAIRITKGTARIASDGGGAVPTLPLPTS